MAESRQNPGHWIQQCIMWPFWTNHVFNAYIKITHAVPTTNSTVDHSEYVANIKAVSSYMVTQTKKFKPVIAAKNPARGASFYRTAGPTTWRGRRGGEEEKSRQRNYPLNSTKYRPQIWIIYLILPVVSLVQIELANYLLLIETQIWKESRRE